MKIKRAPLIGNSHSTARRQSGAVLLLVTFSLIAFLGLAALAIDIGRMYIVKSELQNAADAGALRAALVLNGTVSGVQNALTKGIEGALKNKTLLATGALTSGDLTIEVGPSPNGSTWYPAISVTNEPNDYYYARVTATKTGIHSFFAGVLGIFQNGASAVAIAGRAPGSDTLPLFVPAVRRNADQIDTANACDGRLWDESGGASCPSYGNGSVSYRGYDPRNKWGFLKPGETFTPPSPDPLYGVPTSQWDYSVDKKGNTLPPDPNGSYYLLAAKSNGTAPDAWAFTPAAAWTGNFGWMLADPNSSGQLNQVMEKVLCTGRPPYYYSVQSCAENKTGNGPRPRFEDALNTRFGIAPQPALKDITDWTTQCPADSNTLTYSAPTLTSDYTTYQPTGSGRRVVRVWVVDNAWGKGYQPSLTQCYDPLRGGSNQRQAHIVGCAAFFMWTQADAKTGLIYGEFIDRVPDAQCTMGSTAQTFGQVRLFR